VTAWLWLLLPAATICMGAMLLGTTLLIIRVTWLIERCWRRRRSQPRGF